MDGKTENSLKKSVARRIFLYMFLFCTAVMILFTVLAKIGVEMAGDFFTRSRMEQMANIRDVKKAKVEDFFKERRKDMEILVQTVETIRETAFEKLGNMQQIKKNRVEDHLRHVMEKAELLSAVPPVRNALSAFASALAADRDIQSPLYREQESLFAEPLKNLSLHRGFPDMYLVSEDGTVVYSVNKGVETGQNLRTGGLADSPLARCFLKAREGIFFQDFEPFAALNNDFAAFIGLPLEKNGERAGVLILRFSIDPVNDILRSREGMGKTGESILLGKNGDEITFRCTLAGSDPPPCRMGLPYASFRPELMETAFSGKTVRSVITDEKGIAHLIHADPLNFKGINWVCLSRVEMEEVMSPRSGESPASEDFYQRYIREFGYYDLFLVRPDGNILYAVRHKTSRGNSFFSPGLSETSLSRLLRGVMESRTYGIADYEIFEPANSMPAAFIAFPLLHEQKTELIAVLHLTADFMNEIMEAPETMGSSGRTYLVGSDGNLRSDLSGTDTVVNHMRNPGQNRMDSPSVRQALAGKTGVDISTDYKGRKVISAYTPVQIGDFRWALLAETEAEEFISNTQALQKLFVQISKSSMGFLAGILILILILLLGMIRFLRNRVLVPLRRASDTISRLAEYDLSVNVDSREEDEVGHLLRAVKEMTGNLKKMIAQVSETAEYMASSTDEITDAIGEQSAVASQQAASVSEISSTMEEFSASSAQIAENADAVVRIAGRSLEHTRSSVQSVDLLTDKMRKISENNRNNVREIGDLGRKSEEISKIMSFINHIADQTKLIAFNAAIEASGAGEAGKRFSVVAVEIRRLADSVTSSTDEIRSKIREIQEAAHQMVITSETGSKGIAEGLEMFKEIEKIFQDILHGAEETSNAARQISFSTQQQKTAAEQVVNALRDIAGGSGQTSLSIQQISFVVSRLKNFSDNLQQLMNRFILEKASPPSGPKIILNLPEEEDSEWEDI